MCDITQHFILCSCRDQTNEFPVHNKKSRRAKKQLEENNPEKLVWTLFKYEGREWIGMDGMMIPPSEKLREGFSSEYICSELNSRKCFDFDYQPSEGDYLEIRDSQTQSNLNSSQYMPFIFRNGNWTINYYNSFYEKTIEIDRGIIRYL